MLLERGAGSHGWRMLLGLSAAELFSWGIVYYSFAVMVRPIEAELGWSRTQVTGAFSLALLVSGLAAVPVGHWLDARGPRALMTAGSALGALLFFALSRVETLPAFYAVWLGLGLVMAMVLYEPAFAVVATWFDRERDRALTILTLFGGLASTFLVPLTAWLVETRGWRGAAARLALLLGATTIPLHALFLRAGPPAVGRRVDGERDTPGPPPAPAVGGLAEAVAEGRFWRLTGAFALASVAAAAIGVHLVSYLTSAGVSPGRAAAALAGIGLMQLPGRLAFGSVRRRLSWPWAGAAIFALQALAALVLLRATAPALLAIFVCLFGLANGAATLLRASGFAEIFGPARYGRVSGLATLFATLGRAAGPVAASVMALAWGYGITFVALATLLVAGAGLLVVPSLAAGRTNGNQDMLISLCQPPSSTSAGSRGSSRRWATKPG
jgi:MFS family permease